MNSAAVLNTPDPTKAEPGGLSERIEARLSRCLGQSESLPRQRNGSSHTVSRPQSVPPLRASASEAFASYEEGAVRLPGLNGRSVRQLRHLQSVRVIQRAFVSACAAGALVVAAGLAVPAYAEASAAAQPMLPPVQVMTISPSATIPALDRDGYSVTAPPPVQWPTVLHTKISDGFGARVSPCAGCSTMHAGVDFDAGWGADVHAIAAGVVVETNDPFFVSLGNHMTIEHVIDGQIVRSVYGHMQWGSTSLKVGDTVTPGQVIGRVGSTGASTGPHLHFEIRIGGTAVNPLNWLRAHTQ